MVQLLCPQCGHNIQRLIDVPDHLRTGTSRLDELSKSNEIPSSFELASLTQTASESRHMEELLTNVISEVGLLLQNLMQVRKTVAELASKRKLILHPMRYLPRDILLEIFAFSALFDDNTLTKSFNNNLNVEPLNSLDGRQAPWTLSQVSSRWREESLSFPRMWSSVGVHLTPERRFTPWRSHIALSSQLQRAASHPLTVAITCTLDQATFAEKAESIMQLLVSSSPRWKSLYFRANRGDVLARVQGFLPFLSILYLSTLRKPPVGHAPFIFQKCPQLHTIFTYAPFIEFFQLPGRQIKEWRAPDRVGYAPRPAYVLRALKALPFIERCELVCRLEDNPPVFRTPLLHPSLRHVSIRGTGMPQLLSQIALPCLESLDVEEETDIAVLIAFLQRSNSSLKYFSSHTASLTVNECVLLLKAMPLLETLSLQCPILYTADFFQKLRDEEPRIAPALQTLILRGPLDSQLLLGLRESRKDMRIRLDSGPLETGH
ncbi:hypothetical protein C8J56DRAFT_1162523 [Mycena floridula]|nr:hypothetical protein C8J56DRAFT_1162523 [Mycena floridula]